MAAKTIKLADVIDNTSSIVKHDPHFARLYLNEIEALLEVIWQGHPALYERARWQVLKGQRMLDRMFKLAKRA